ncbi:MAG: hypothetical protein D5R98_09415 [Desulfonatronovibrio sp. MSAO_Bac4]|nr:MAG: hypothetical protein D5R98_09415 [Desulfonatronovibrio sp. MSAO_Bac4]
MHIFSRKYIKLILVGENMQETVIQDALKFKNLMEKSGGVAGGNKPYYCKWRYLDKSCTTCKQTLKPPGYFLGALP